MSQIKKGLLSVTKVKSGKYIATIKFDDGKNAPSLSAYSFTDDKLHGKPCVVQLENGQVIKIEVDGNEVGKSHRSTHLEYMLQNQSSPEVTFMPDSFVIENTRLPSDTRSALQDILPDNFALKLNKAVRFDKVNNENKPDNKFYFFKNQQGKPKLKIPDEKYLIKPIFDFNFSIFLNQQIHRANVLFGQKYFIIINKEVDWRLVVGLGNESVYETSMTLHHIYGFPYIPASAIKGVVRSWIITEVFGNFNIPNEEKYYTLINAEHRAYSNKAFCTIFGCPKETKKVKFDANNKPSFINEEKHIYDTESLPTALEKEYQGAVWFFDAYPMTAPTIKVDIMNPHYGEYYSDKKGKVNPADYLSPIPIPFLTVENVSFQFIIGVKPSDNTTFNELNDLEVLISADVKLKQTSTLLEVVQYWLEQALINHGIGAKTAVGYGYMK